MEAKYDTYKKYNWANDQEWQQYLNGLYPVPPLKTLEKFRRKWYKKTRDPAFDVAYDPAQQQQQQQQGYQPGMSEQQRFQQRYAQQYAQQNPAGAYVGQQNNSNDRVPWLRIPHLICLAAFIFAYPIGFFTTPLIVVANVIGLARKGGYPQMSMQYVQGLVFTEEFNNITYVMSILMARKSFFLYTPILISVVLTLCWEGKRILDRNPSTMVLSNATVKNYVLKGAAPQMQEQGRMVRANVEIYVGFFMIAGIFIGQSTLVGAIMYWQMLRMRYMMNPVLQAAFGQLHNHVIGYLSYPMVPAVLLQTYMTVAGFIQSFGDAQAQAERVNASGGGMMGALKNSCSIF